MFESCKEINRQMNKYDLYGYSKSGSILSNDKIYQKEYLAILKELTNLYSDKNTVINSKLLTTPSIDDFKLLRIINACCSLEHDLDVLSKYINISKSEIKKNGYKYRAINTLQSQFLERLFFENEFKKSIYNRELKPEYSINDNIYDLNIIRNNNSSNPLSKFDFDGKIENSIIYIDIKGRYSPNTYFFNNLRDSNGRHLDIDSNKYLNLDVKTIYKYYCRKYHEGCKIWLAFYHNFGPQSFGINFLDFDKLLSYLDIKKKKGAIVPQMLDLKSNPFIIYPFKLQLNDKVINEKKENYSDDIIYYGPGGFNYPESIYFDYTKLCCKTNEFINAITL